MSTADLMLLAGKSEPEALPEATVIDGDGGPVTQSGDPKDDSER